MYPTQGQPSYPYYPTMTYPPSHDLSATQTYGWSYGYPYAMQHQQYQQYGQQAQAAVAAAKTQTTTARTAASTRTSTPAPPPLTHTTSTTTTFSSYTPHHARESVAAAATGGSGTRGSRRQSNLRGIFSKECEYPLARIEAYSVFLLPSATIPLSFQYFSQNWCRDSTCLVFACVP